jgi:hypothetical protein
LSLTAEPSDSLDPFVTDKIAMEAIMSACRLAFRRPRNNLLAPCSVSDKKGIRIDCAAALAVDRAVASDPPDSRIDRAATIAWEVAWERTMASWALATPLFVDFRPVVVERKLDGCGSLWLYASRDDGTPTEELAILTCVRDW